MKNLWLLITFLPLFLFGQTSVPNTETFSLQDVYNAVHAHTSGTQTNLQSCFDNAISGYFNATYNQDSYAPANSMLRFRDYKPSGGGNNPPYVTSYSPVTYFTPQPYVTVLLSNNIQIGDIIIVNINLVGSNTTISTPSGYTEIYKVQSSANYNSWALYYKIATSGDIGSNLTVSIGASSSFESSAISIKGKTTAPYFSTISSSNYYYTTSGISLTANTSGGLANSLILVYWVVGVTPSITATPDPSYTSIIGSNSWSDFIIGTDKSNQTSDGNMNAYTLTTNTSAKMQIFQIQFLPY